MAKRHHQSTADRMAESRGEERHLYRSMRHHNEGYYEGMEPRRRQEMEDAGMIREDHSKIANLPQEVIFKSYPNSGPYMPEVIDDTIRGVDAQMDLDDRQRAKHFVPKKV